MDQISYLLVGAIIVLLLVAMGLPLNGVIRRNLLYLIIPINVLAFVLIQFTGEEEGVLHTGLIRAPIIFFILLLLLPNIKLNLVTVLIAVFLVYLGLLIFLSSSNITYSYSVYMKIFFSLMMIPVSFSMVQNVHSFRKLLISLLVGAAIGATNYIFAQFFKLGIQEYSENAAYLGGTGVYITYLGVYTLIMAPVTMYLLRNRNHRLFALAVYAVMLVIVLVTFRRSSQVALVVGFVVMALVTGWWAKIKIAKYAAVGVILLSLATFFYGDLVFELYQERIVEGYQLELESRGGRVEETRVVWDEFLHKSARHTLIGSEPLNSREYFIRTMQQDRIIHVDYNNILHGSGIIGLTLYLSIFVTIAFQFLSAQRKFPKSQFYSYLGASFWGLLVASIILSISIQWAQLTSFSTLCLLLGAMLGIATNVVQVKEESNLLGKSQLLLGYKESIQ